MNIKEIIRRYQHGQPKSQIATSLDYDRKTVGKYIKALEQTGIQYTEALLGTNDLTHLLEKIIRRKPVQSEKQNMLVAYKEDINFLIKEKRLKVKSAYEVLILQHSDIATVSLSSFRRFVHSQRLMPESKQVTCRIEVEPGSQVQIDYAKVGYLFDAVDKRKRTVYAFIGTLAYSRHKFAEFVFRQDQQSFIGSHKKMFEYFGGVPEQILLDNLKTGVIKPDLYNPQLNRSYQEMAEHYGCFLEPCRVASPKDKPKVERDVQTIREEFKKMLVIDPALTLADANAKIQRWLIEQYGKRAHGTTHEKPYEVFCEIEKLALRSLPKEPFDLTQWKQASVHPDCYVQFNKKSYSVPYQYVGKTVWIRGTSTVIQVFYNDQLIKQHHVAKGFRCTDLSDFPENIQAALNEGLPLQLQQKAKHIGEKFFLLIHTILKPNSFLKLRNAQGLVSLSEKYPPQIIEQASKFCLENYRQVSYKLFKTVIEKLLEQVQVAQETANETFSADSQTESYLRDTNYFSQPISYN